MQKSITRADFEQARRRVRYQNKMVLTEQEHQRLATWKHDTYRKHRSRSVHRQVARNLLCGFNGEVDRAAVRYTIDLSFGVCGNLRENLIKAILAEAKLQRSNHSIAIATAETLATSVKRLTWLLPTLAAVLENHTGKSDLAMALLDRCGTENVWMQKSYLKHLNVDSDALCGRVSVV